MVRKKLLVKETGPAVENIRTSTRRELDTLLFSLSLFSFFSLPFLLLLLFFLSVSLSLDSASSPTCCASCTSRCNGMKVSPRCN